MNGAPPLLAARAAARRFGSRLALWPTDFELGNGESVALVGPNGAGKSTLLALLAGVLEPSAGSVDRRPGALLAFGLLLAGAALGAVGALLGAIAREARTASLVALLVVLPIVFLGLVQPEIVPAAGWISDGLAFIHAVRFFSAALYDASPWGRLLREALWLGGLGALFGLLARIGTRRLLA